MYIRKNTNLIDIYFYLKAFCTLLKYIPTSIYIITFETTGALTKSKESLTRYRNISLGEFIDIFNASYSTLLTSSGESGPVDIGGWEIRFYYTIPTDEFETTVEMCQKV